MLIVYDGLRRGKLTWTLGCLWFPTLPRKLCQVWRENIQFERNICLEVLLSLSWQINVPDLKVDVPILPCVFYAFNWLTLTSEMYFVRFYPEVTSCLLSRGKTKYATLGMRLWCKYIRNYLLVYQLTSHFLPYLRNYKEFEGEISDLQLEKYGLSFETKKYATSGWARGDENVIGIRAFN